MPKLPEIYLTVDVLEETEALIAERDSLKEACDGYLAHAASLRLENASLAERVSELEQVLENIVKDAPCYTYPWVVNIARAALERIKFRNHPGTTNHELAKEALSLTSEEA
jgi:regulator of replication initiation timing